MIARLILGDCLEHISHVGTKVDLVLTDLPYGTTNCRWDTPIDLQHFWLKLSQVRNDNTAVVMTAQTPFDKVLGCSNLNELRYEWIWEKTSATGHLNSKKMPMKAHENILVFYKSLPKYFPIKTRGHVRKTATKVGDTTDVYGSQSFDALLYDSTERFPRSVLLFASDKQFNALHSTQKPVELMEYLVKTYTEEGDTVLDCCMGSGTTGVACARTNRNFVGIEISSDIFKVAEQRIKNENVILV